MLKPDVCFLHPQSPLQNYKNTLQTQVLESAGERYNSVKFGDNLSQKKLNDFQDEQISQLYELMVESTKSKRQFDIQEDRKWSCRPESGAWTERKQKQTTYDYDEFKLMSALGKGWCSKESFKNIWLR